jgi:hypothetical protein
MTAPYWVTSANQGNINLTTANFNISPLVLSFNSTNLGSAKVSLINGSLPNGLTWTQGTGTNAGSVLINGQPSTVQTSAWTFRIQDVNGVSDRTFSANIITTASNPSWVGQSTNLGYVSSLLPLTTTVIATNPTNQPLTYNIISSTVTNHLTIDPQYGIITYAPTVDVVTPTTVTIVVRARAGNSYTDQTFTITQVPVPYQPIWITTSGLIATVIGGQYFDSQLQIVNSSTGTPTFSLVAVAGQGLPPGIHLSSTGLLYGHTTNLSADTLFTFTVLVTTVGGSTSQQMSIQIKALINSLIFNINQSTTDLGTVKEGTIVALDVSASSTRTQLIAYSVVGGRLPVGTILDKTHGQVVGFVEYQPKDQDYWFEIDAWDGTNHLVTQYHVKTTGYQKKYMTVEIPVWGPLKDKWIEANQLLIGSFVTQPNQDVIPIDNLHPSMNLLDGLDYGWTSPNQIVDTMSGIFETIELQFGAIDNVAIDTNSVQVYRHVLDPQLASVDVTKNTANQTIEVIGLNHWRRALSASMPFVTAGSGTGAILLPNINLSSQITSVQVSNPGSGYYSKPIIGTTGSGGGATFDCTLKILGTTSIAYSVGVWNIGDTITIDAGIYITPAVLTVSAIDGQSNLVSLTVTNAGEYLQFPQGMQQISNSNQAVAKAIFNLGIKQVQVLTSGTGYDDTTMVTVLGNEVLPSWETSWQPIIDACVVTTSSLPTLLSNETTENLDVLDGYTWPVNYVILDFQGKTWMGSNLFDQNLMTFDGGQTTFDEFASPNLTTFDQSQSIFDHGLTNFDIDPSYQQQTEEVWGLTMFDNNSTLFDNETTIFDSAPVNMKSQTLVRKIIKF